MNVDLVRAFNRCCAAVRHSGADELKDDKKYIYILLILLFSAGTSSSSQWPDCGFQCRAGDVDVKDVWIGDSQGNSLSPCSPESRSTAYIWASFENNANAPRYAVILLADIYVDGVLRTSFYDQGLCVLNSIPPKAARSMPLYSLPLTCGQQIGLKRLILSWETAQGTDCGNVQRKCSNRNTKCFRGEDIEIPVSYPLTADFAADDTACCCRDIILLDRTAGGYSPYYYLWDFGDGSDKSRLQNPTHGYDAPGQYNISLEASDSRGSFSRIAKKISIFPGPSAEAGPDLSIRPGGTIRLKGSALEGTYPYVYVWSPDAGLDDPSSPKPLASPKNTTIYNLSIEDAHGCRGFDNMALFVSSISITKSILYNPVERGKEAVYNYLIENRGDCDLENITVIDSVFGQVFGPLQGDENGDGKLNSGESWIYQMVFRPLANATSNARVYAADPAGTVLSAESARIAVNVTSSPEPLQCQILGMNIVCEDVAAFYSPRIIGEDSAPFNFTWRVDGSKIVDPSNNGGVEVYWMHYGGGYHALQLRADRICDEAKKCNDGRKNQTGSCEMNVLVVEVPSAAIELDSG